jgi:uroporphyrinogen-III synthase
MHVSSKGIKPARALRCATNHCRTAFRPLTVISRGVVFPAASFDVSTSNLVVLTREKGKNDKVKEMLDKLGVQSVEVPMVETTPGPDVDRLPAILQNTEFDWIAITSPEAASVFIEGWKAAGKPDVRIGVVGKGTGNVLEATNEPTLKPQFTPSIANAEHMGPELPRIEGGTNVVLYPSSAKASTVLQEGLECRGFQVVRLNTYNTVTVKSIEVETLELAKRARVVAIASPSALKAWVEHVGQARAKEMTIACIGSTSARAAEKLGLKKVLFPEHPGLDMFVQTICEAVDHM